jgi:hypothetical protein
MTPEYARNWYPIERITEITGACERTLRNRLANVSDQNVRFDASRGGRPRALYHFSVLPELAVHHRGQISEVSDQPSVSSVPSVPSSYVNVPDKPAPKPPPKPKGAAKDDLVRAELRLRAVREFEERRKLMSAEQAAEATCRDWANRPRVETTQTTERLPGGHSRCIRIQVDLGIFKPGTLRTWAGTYAASGRNVLSLVDRMKGHVGRKQKEIPPELLSYIYGLSASTSRADVAKAVAWAMRHAPCPMPSVSLDTWRRRIKAFDPRKAGKDLNHSISKFRGNHSPDVEIDWNQLPYNGLWQIDDVHEDWYALASDLEYVMRPNAYAIMRARTRKWVAFVATETPITQAQVRELVGFAMCQPGGGLPDVFKFEHGTVAGDSHLDQALDTLAVRVSRTGMDGGAVVPGAVADVATGHFQGKALIERGFRGHHDANWLVPAQVGADERNTAAARLQRYIKLEKVAGRDPGIVVLPTPGQWHARIKAAFEEHNNTPHGGLPEICTDTGEVRHATPNEMEKSLGDQAIRRMDEKLLPLFQVKGVVVPVTRNGFTLNNNSYGRFDEELVKHDKVLAYASEVCPGLAYVEELGRCVELYVKAAPGDSEQFGQKRHIEKAHRNQHEALMAEALASGDQRFIESMMMLSNPTPNRPETVVAPAAMVETVERMQSSRAAHRDRRAAQDRRFEVPGPFAVADRQGRQATPPRARRGMLSRSEELGDQLVALGGGKDMSAVALAEEADSWKQS